MYSIRFKKSAEKELEKLPAPAIKKISKAVDALSTNPRPVSSKKLEGQKESLWRIRIGDYRVIYLIEEVVKIIEIRRIGHRRDVYTK
ncbi:MAG: type II toxin-antitoxin system RelE family toxin [Cytophagales bacterium]